MTKYQVLSPIKIDDTIVKDGYAEIPDTEVAELTKLGTIGDIEPSAQDSQALRLDTIVAAIGQMDKENADLWLKDGKPSTEAIVLITGFAITADERNAAWALIVAAQG